MNTFYSWHRGRRRGVAAVYVTLCLFMLIGVTAFAIDMSWLYTRKAVAQKAADAAALSGAFRLAHNAPAEADSNAIYYAGLAANGGYVRGVRGGVVTIGKWVTGLAANQQAVAQPNHYKVSVSRMEPTFFAGIFGPQFRQMRIGASATALYENNAEIPIKGTGTYGVAPGPVNLSLFGPDAWYNNGDRYSTRLLSNNPQTANKEYHGPGSAVAESEQGYSFSINLDAFRGKAGNNRAYLQIFDPDCYNANNGVNAVAGTSVDEMRTATGGNGTSANATTTKYKLWMDPDGPTSADGLSGTDPEVPVAGGEQSFGSTSTTDMLWNDIISADVSQIPVNAKLRLQVVSTDGESENGFDLRVDNKPAASSAMQIAERSRTEAAKSTANRFDPNNGSVITAQGHIPINFNQDGSVVMALGNIPKSAAGGLMTVTNFDTDVTAGSAANTVIFKCDPPVAGQPFTGILSPQGEWRDTRIPLPANYQGGNWTATYSAGAQDTSVWDMSYANGPGDPSGKIRLVE